MTGFVAAWYRRMAPALYPRDMRFLNASHWTPALHAHFTAPGTAGKYRRQAGELYPLLAPVLAHDPETVALIDAGRPYERRVCEVLNGLRLDGRDDGFSLAKLRCLRGVRPMARIAWMQDFLLLAARLPTDRMHLLTRSIPGLPTGYVNIAYASRWCLALGLDLDLITARMTETPPVPVMRDAGDMARRCAETLVVPILGTRATPLAHVISGRLLLDGLDLARVMTLSDRWHDRMESFENALPEGKDLVTWPALFAPYERNGVRISCLTVQSQLRAEGSSTRDRDGVMGLGHCVGGYGLQCYVGTSHVASVRQWQGGTWTRISTLEIAASRGERPRLVQLRGASNAFPPDDAIREVDNLIFNLRNGSIPMDPAALAPRDESGFRDGVRWTAPGSILKSWHAWRPYLPKRIAAMDLAGFKAHVRGMGRDVIDDARLNPSLGQMP